MRVWGIALFACLFALANVAHAQNASIASADAKLVEACGRDLTSDSSGTCEPLTDARRDAWREAATLYESASAADPSRTAFRAAFASEMLGDFSRAMRDYEQLLASTYAAESTLQSLEHAHHDEYQTRLERISSALSAQALDAYRSFAYASAAETYLRTASLARLRDQQRIGAGKTAMLIFGALGNRPKMLQAMTPLTHIALPRETRASLDYLIAQYDFDHGAFTNAQTRTNAINALSGFYESNRKNDFAQKYVVEAAWRVARLYKSVGDGRYLDWYGKTVIAWDLFHAASPTESQQAPFADYAAEAEFIPLDQQIRDTFDYDTGHAQYVKLNAMQIMGQRPLPGVFENDTKRANDFDIKLEHIESKYSSREWMPAVIARRGSLYDSLRRGLYWCGGSQFSVMTPQIAANLTQMRNSGTQNLIGKAWRDFRDREIESASEIVVRRDAEAVAMGTAHNVHNEWTASAIARLAELTNLIGDATLRTFVTGTVDPTNHAKYLHYTNGMYERMRAGLPLAETPSGVAGMRPLASL